MLELVESVVEVEDDEEVDWISCFPETQTNMESLVFDCVEVPINFEALEGLVARSPRLKKLRLNQFVSMAQLYRLLLRAPQLTHLGTGSFSATEVAFGVLFRVCTDPSNGLMPDSKMRLKGNTKRILDLMKKLRVTEVQYHKDLLLAIVEAKASFGLSYLKEFPYNIDNFKSSSWLVLFMWIFFVVAVVMLLCWQCNI